MNKTDLRYVKTEELIENAFLACIEETEFNHMTVTQLCAKARVSRFTFYSHYEDMFHLKEALFRILEKNLSSSLSPAVLEHAKNGSFMPSAERYIQDICANKKLLKGLLKCDRENTAQVIGRVFLDSVTALYIDHYNRIVESDPVIQLTRNYFINALAGYAEALLNMRAAIPEKELILHFHALIAHTGSHFVQQLRAVRLA